MEAWRCRLEFSEKPGISKLGSSRMMDEARDQMSCMGFAHRLCLAKFAESPPKFSQGRCCFEIPLDSNSLSGDPRKLQTGQSIKHTQH
jgi:hypothetical protein